MPEQKLSAFDQEKLERIKNYEKLDEWKQLSSSWCQCAFDNKYMYNFNWLGRPIIQLPSDIIALQEIIWATKPDLIIETGVAHGGTLTLSASLMVLLDEIEDVSRQNDLKRKVIGIDIDVRPENFKQLQSHPLKHRMELIEGSSVDDVVIQKIAKLSEGYKNIFVYLDSNHTHEHVLSELEKYTQFVSVGSYCIVFDTVIERLNGNTFPNRPWGRGNNPATAIKEFLYKQDQNKNDQPRFVLDKEVDNKLMISAASGGWLKRIS